MLRPPILIDIRKDHFTVNPLGTPPQNSKELLKGKRVFYKTPRIVIDEFENNVSDIKHILQKFQPQNIGSIVKPVVILNIPYDVTPVEINSLKELSVMAGAREVIILNETEMPLNLKPNHKIPGKVIYGDDRFTSDDGFLLFILGLIIFGSWVLYMSATN